MKIIFIKPDKFDQNLIQRCLQGYDQNNFQIVNKDNIPDTPIDPYTYLIIYDDTMNNVVRDMENKGIRHFPINIVSANNQKVLTTIISNMLGVKKEYQPPSKDLVRLASIDQNDESALLHGSQKHIGTIPTINIPMIFGKYGHNMWFENMFSGRSCFLVLSGPSLLNIDYKKLNNAACLSMGVNNSPRTIRTNLWVSVDNPTHFIKSIWLDSKIMKFVPYTHVHKPLFDNQKWQMMDLTVGDCPNVWYFKRNELFDAERFMFEDTFNWGNSGDTGGGRSVMLVAIRLLYYLGIRTVFLLGCDFKMNENTKYHFNQDRSRGSISGNNSSYIKLIDRFEKLKPIFDKLGYKIFNCYQESGLKVFPHVPFEDAIRIAMEEMPDVANERTEGLYERDKAN